MKRNLIYLAALSALALTACSQDEAVNEIHPVAESAIGFRSNLDRATVSRGQNATTEQNFAAFSVVALNEDNSTYFHKLEVTKGDNGVWTYNPVQYWPKGRGLRFFAAGNSGSQGFVEKLNSGNFPGFSKFAPHNGGYTYDPTGNNGQGVFGGTSVTTHAHHDLVYAYHEGSYVAGSDPTQTTAVNLNFKHALSQIEVRAINTNPNREIEIIGVRIKNLKGQGDATFTGISDTYSGSTPNVGISWNLGDVSQTNTSDYFFRFPAKYSTPHLLDGANGVDEQSINIAPGNFNFMVIPQNTEAWAKIIGNDDNGGTYISVACRIYSVSTAEGSNTPTKTLLYPAHGGDENNKLYGLAMVPVQFSLKAGMKYTYTLNFSNGSGLVDPDPNPSNPDGSGDLDPSPGPGGSEGGDEIDGHPIQFTVTVNGWGTPSNSDVEM